MNRDATRTQASSLRSNGLWDALQQGITTAANGATSFILVAVLAVSDYGLYSYALAVVSIAMSVMNAGLGGLAVRHLMRDRPSNRQIVSMVVFARLSLSFVGYGLAATVAWASGGSDSLVPTLIALICLFGKSLEGPEAWFLSKMRSRRTAVARVAVSILFFGLRMAAIIWAPTVNTFVALVAFEGLVSGFAILTLYRREEDSPGVTRPSVRRTLALLRESLPLTLSGIANQVTLRADILVIQASLGAAAVGVYALAAKIGELAYMLPVVFLNSLLPRLLELRATPDGRNGEFEHLLRRAYRLAFWSGMGIAVVVAAAGALFIPAVFGSDYRASPSILSIYVLACPFVFMAAVYSKWIIAEGVLWASLTRHVLGAAAAVIGSLLLVRAYGPVGAAYATVAAYITASFLSAFLSRTTRPQARLMAAAILFPGTVLYDRVMRLIGAKGSHV